MFEEDASVFFEDFALRVATSEKDVARGGILDMPQRFTTDDGDVAVTDYSLLVRTSEFGGLRIGAFVTVDGVKYRVRREPFKHVDGLFSTLHLMRATEPPVVIDPSVFAVDVFVEGVFV